MTYALHFPAARSSVFVEIEVVRVFPSLAVFYIGLLDDNIISSARSVDPSKLEGVHSQTRKASRVGSRGLDPVRLQACTVVLRSPLVDKNPGLAGRRDGDDIIPEVTVDIDQANAGHVSHVC
jgi:hypothetical protein